jgi:murein L,D-transpeptidase YafK
MTPVNLARHRDNPNMAFWKMLKIGNDHFEATRLEPKVEACDRRYVFDAQGPPRSSEPLVFDPARAARENQKGWRAGHPRHQQYAERLHGRSCGFT